MFVFLEHSISLLSAVFAFITIVSLSLIPVDFHILFIAIVLRCVPSIDVHSLLMGCYSNVFCLPCFLSYRRSRCLFPSLLFTVRYPLTSIFFVVCRGRRSNTMNQELRDILWLSEVFVCHSRSSSLSYHVTFRRFEWWETCWWWQWAANASNWQQITRRGDCQKL